jgi:hypothetical protein
MVHTKSPGTTQGPLHRKKMGQVSFVSSVSATPTFRTGGKKGIHFPILSAVKIDYVSIDEGIDVVLWGSQDQ